MQHANRSPRRENLDGDRTTKVVLAARESHSMLSVTVLPTAIIITYQQSTRNLKLCA
jgi:hypothetical protein